MTNHAVVAMVGNDVKQTRCTTCDADHEYKHAKIPRPRKKGDAPAALYAQVAAGAPKRVTHEIASANGGPADDALASDVQNDTSADPPRVAEESEEAPPAAIGAQHDDVEATDEENEGGQDEGPIHRRLIRASLPRPEGQQPPARPIPEFTIRQPGGGRPNRFRPRHQRGGHGPQGPQFHGGGHRAGGGGNTGGSMRGPRPAGGRPGMKRHGGPHGRKRSK